MITKDMTIGDVLTQVPGAAEILQMQGVHCVGCGGAYEETIEEGLSSHGMSDEQIRDVVDKINGMEVSGDPETVTITTKAAQKVRQFLDASGKSCGLRIGVRPGGCSGFSYSFDFEEAKGENDLVIEQDDVTFYVDKTALNFLKGAVIDYVDTLQDSGFKVSNPNAQSTCGCGQSFQ